jgi:hypothetical protein
MENQVIKFEIAVHDARSVFWLVRAEHGDHFLDVRYWSHSFLRVHVNDGSLLSRYRGERLDLTVVETKWFAERTQAYGFVIHEMELRQCLHR